VSGGGCVCVCVCGVWGVGVGESLHLPLLNCGGMRFVVEGVSLWCLCNACATIGCRVGCSQFQDLSQACCV